jgi:hypothetical protein
MPRVNEGPVHVTGEGRDLSSSSGALPVRIELGDDGFSLELDGQAPLRANYRDLTTIAVDQGRVLLVLAGGQARFMLERLGAAAGRLVGELRDRRARQQLADRFIDLPSDEAIELVEYRSADRTGEAEHGVGQLAYHPWGAALLPLDERREWRLVRRADIAAVEGEPATGTVRITLTHRAGAPSPEIELLGLGAAAVRQQARLDGLRAAALADAAAIVGRLLPDAALAIRRIASSLLVDGRPAARDALGDEWPTVEQVLLSEPTFAASYAALNLRAGTDAPSWVALAPRQPGNPDDHVAWFFVALPGNLVALELVSAGAHATYLFRVVPRADYRGQAPTELVEPANDAVNDISEALIDARFLREPIYLPAARLVDARFLRYRLAIAALPSLRAARRRFVARLIHRDEEAWQAGLDGLIAWHAGSRTDAEQWTGGSATADELEEEGT